VDENGTPYVPVKITNPSEKPSDYFIEIAMDSEDGLGTIPVYVSGLNPGQTADEHAVLRSWQSQHQSSKTNTARAQSAIRRRRRLRALLLRPAKSDDVGDLQGSCS
jgi:hypothetical protein